MQGQSFGEFQKLKGKTMHDVSFFKISNIFITTILASIILNACQKNPDTSKSAQDDVKKTEVSAKKSLPNADTSSGLEGCYTVSKTEPAQIKINLDNSNYTMQMREFNDPDKPWDKPETMQLLPKSEVKKYFDIEEKAVEQVITRPDKVFVLAQVQDSLMNLDKRFDSNYLGYIYKGSNTVYKVKCEK